MQTSTTPATLLAPDPRLAPDIRTIASERLRALKQNVIPADKIKAREDLNICRQTIDNYLSGRVKRIDLALLLIDYLSPIVRDRLSNLTQ